VLSEIFSEFEVNSYQKMRAIIATLNNMAFLANPLCEHWTICDTAEMAIESAEVLLEQLGVVNPDQQAA
jgi:hypothetical protein